MSTEADAEASLVNLSKGDLNASFSTAGITIY